MQRLTADARNVMRRKQVVGKKAYKHLMSDPYYQLRPEPPTPEDERCDCDEILELFLDHCLGSNPLRCLQCGGEVLPDKLGFDQRLAQDIAFWNDVYGALYTLWLNSGEYELWARDRLLDPKGQVNVDGRSVAKQLGRYVKTYYAWLRDHDEAAPRTCPVCGATLVEKKGSSFLVCEPCLVVI